MKKYTTTELEEQRLTGEEITIAISAYQTTVNKLKIQDSYYQGKNYSILKDPEGSSPDNRLTVAFGRKAVNTVSGYMGKVGNITFSTEDDKVNELLKDINDVNSAAIETNTELVKALVNGRTYELHYIEDSVAKFASISAENIIPYYNSEIKPEIYRFIYYYSSVSIVDSKVVYNVSVYYQDKIEYFEKKEGDEKYVFTGDETLYYGGNLPIVEYVINKDKSNLFDHVISIIDQHDKVMSEDIANELERFANTYLMTSYDIDNITKDANGKTDLDKLKSKRIFQGMDKEDFLKYLTKEINDAFITNSADRFERLIYEMLQIPNFNDEKFGSASGIAIAYRLIDFENLCSSIEAFFTIGLNRRYELIAEVSNKLNKDKIGAIEIKFIRNLPFDLAALAETVTKLQEVLSHETILKLFPKYIVPDVDEEMKKIEKEKQEDTKRIADVMDKDGDRIDDGDDGAEDDTSIDE
jgi:SPP1 family phage portal protein